jgi:hypothetical protein
MAKSKVTLEVEYRVFAALGAFLLLTGGVYWWLSREPVGIAGMILAGLFGLMIAFFLWYTGKNVDARPEDDPNAEIADMAGDYGTFSPHSWWPLILAAFAAITGLGIIFGWWMFIIGLVGVIFGTIGLVFEYYREPYLDDAH